MQTTDHNKRPTLLVTGGAGFLGSRLAVRAADAYDVTVVDNLVRNSLPFLTDRERERFRFLEGDVTDAAFVKEAARGADYVVHLAAIAGVHNYYERPYDVMRVNFGGTLALLDALASAPPTRLVFVSTSEVYGRHATDADEDDLLQVEHYSEPRWTYAVSKIAAEKSCFAWGRQYGADVVSLRPFNVYGPGQTGAGAVRDMVLAALAGDEIVVHGDGRQVRAWCYLDDFVDATLAALIAPDIGGQVFNIGNPETAVTVSELAERIVAAAGGGSTIIRKPHFGTDIPHRTPRVDKARRLLDYQPRTPLDEGLAHTVAWYREHG